MQEKSVQDIKLTDRSFITLSGINKIISFNDEEFLLESTLGNIHIKGSGLDVIKMDTVDGNVKIKGTINSIIYLDSKYKDNKDGFFAKLFK